MFCLWERLILGLTKYVFAFKKMIENLLHTVDSLVHNAQELYVCCGCGVGICCSGGGGGGSIGGGGICGAGGVVVAVMGVALALALMMSV